MEKYFYIAVTVALTACGQLMVKGRAIVHAPAVSGKIGYIMAMYTDPAVLAALMAALLASVSWTLALEKAPLSVAYPMMAMNFVVVPTLAALIFGEPLSASRVVALCVIVVGVLMIGLSS
jgi:drug/metabolite transporter (DMT)-like permease